MRAKVVRLEYIAAHQTLIFSSFFFCFFVSGFLFGASSLVWNELYVSRISPEIRDQVNRGDGRMSDLLFFLFGGRYEHVGSPAPVIQGLLLHLEQHTHN